MSKKNPFKKNKYEIFYHLINAGLAAILVLLGSLTSGNITKEGIILALIAGLVVIFVKCKEYWDGQANEYTTKLFSFIN